MRPLTCFTCDCEDISAKNVAKLYNLVQGKWTTSKNTVKIPDPYNGEMFIESPATSVSEIQPFVDSLKSVPKSGMHNPFKSNERYLMYGRISAEAATLMRKPEVENYFARLVQRVSPKSLAQARGEVIVTRRFLENFSGDNVRFLARSFQVPGDHEGQISSGHRWPYGPVALITPFNFPIEIPVLQLMGSLYMGNKPLIKSASKVSIVIEQFIRMMHSCGMPMEDVDLIHCDGPTMHKLLMTAQPRMTQFTGSSKVAEMLARDLHGKVKIEDAGFDFKILGPDVPTKDTADAVNYVAYVCDQDAYASSGQKCSAQSILFAHTNWVEAGLFGKMETLAARRNYADMTVGPVLTVTTERAMAHIKSLLALPGSKLLFGGKPLMGGKHVIPKIYGAWEPTAVFVPLKSILATSESYALCFTELFGPLQVVTEFDDTNVDQVLEACERMDHHLTAGIVSNDVNFRNKCLGATVNGTTYVGLKARTTGAPQNHWFGPAGDPRGAGIGTKEAIQLVWSSHREIVVDEGTPPKGWQTPVAS